MRLMLCGQCDDDCNRLCSARRSELAPCGWAAGFDDREMFELLLDRDTARPCINPATWRPASPWASPWASSGTTSTTSTAAPRSPASRPPTGCQRPRAARPQPRHAGETVPAGPGPYPVAISEAHEQAVITGHDREEFRRMTLMLLEQRGLPTPESAKATSKRRPWV